MGTAVAAAVATVVAAAVAGLTGWLTARASARGSVQAAQVTTLAELEREAGQRMAGIYDTALTQLKAENTELRAEVDRLRTAVTECRETCKRLHRGT